MTSDAELIGRSLLGDEQAFIEVIRRHEAAVGAYLARRVGRAPGPAVTGRRSGGARDDAGRPGQQ